MAYEMAPTTVQSAKGAIETAHPVWESEPVTLDLTEAMGDSKARRGPTPEKTIKVAKWLLGYLRSRGDAVPFREVVNAAGDNGLAGELKLDSEGRMRWSNPRMLYLAKDAVRALDDSDNGWMVEDTKCGNVTFWRAVQTGELPIHGNNCKPSKPPCF